MINLFKYIKNLLCLPNNIVIIKNSIIELENEFEEHKKEILILLQNESLKTESTTEKLINNHFSQLESLIQIYKNFPKLHELPNTRGWAGSPDFLAEITRMIFKQKPKLVLELGSGVSTIVIGSSLQKNDKGMVLSLDHKEEYATLTQEKIKTNELDGNSYAKYCPLKKYVIEAEDWLWYDIANINLEHNIDMVIIDGPPGSIQKMARYPALPLLFDSLSEESILILDDSKRKDEIKIIDKWLFYLRERRCKVRLEKFNHFEKGMAVFIIEKLK